MRSASGVQAQFDATRDDATQLVQRETDGDTQPPAGGFRVADDQGTFGRPEGSGGEATGDGTKNEKPLCAKDGIAVQGGVVWHVPKRAEDDGRLQAVPIA